MPWPKGKPQPHKQKISDEAFIDAYTKLGPNAMSLEYQLNLSAIHTRRKLIEESRQLADKRQWKVDS